MGAAAADMACKDTSIQRSCKDRAGSILKPSASERTMGAKKISQKFDIQVLSRVIAAPTDVESAPRTFFSCIQ